jgi:hypothetical protein
MGDAEDGQAVAGQQSLDSATQRLWVSKPLPCFDKGTQCGGMMSDLPLGLCTMRQYRVLAGKGEHTLLSIPILLSLQSFLFVSSHTCSLVGYQSD